uniref:Glycosyltransferase family 2 protein n=1 Tax=Fervidobacterium pennivorans TaxID=93466 RepID=A0A7C4RXZ6_FERPE
MSSELLLSFVIPAYNVERYISKTLGSLLSQTDKDFEIIVVDDGSTDNTYNVAKEILEKSGFSNYTILRKPNGGVSSARNMGIKHAKGKYIIFLDGDDYVSPKLVEKVKEVVSKSDVDMVCWKFLQVSESGEPTKYQFPFWGLEEGKIYTGSQVLEKILVEKSFRIWTASAAYSRKVMLQNNLFYNENHRVG